MPVGNSKRILVLIFYIIVFWLIIPAALIGGSLIMDRADVLPSVKGYTGPGWAIAAISAIMLALSITQFNQDARVLPVSAFPPDHIVRKGIYRFYRHPIYLFYTTLFIGIALILGSGAMVFVVMPVFACLVFLYVMLEERALLKRFGCDYQAYREQAGLAIPKFHMMLYIPFIILSKIYFPITVRNKEFIPARAPFFIVANHRNYLDPFLIACTLPYKIHYVTTHEMFRKKITRLFFTALGCISKKRYLYDGAAVKRIIHVLKNGGVIGIFPEGERSYTGELLELKPEPMKLFKKFNDVPVIPVAVSGNYIMWPRWGRGWRSCGITVTYHEPIVPRLGESLENLRDRIVRGITPDDTGKMTRHAKRAHSIECFLYRCPECREFDCLCSRKEVLYCTQCGHEWYLQGSYLLKDIETGKETTIQELYERLRICRRDATVAPAGMRSGRCCCYVEEGNVFRPLVTGHVHLDSRGLTVCRDDVADELVTIAIRDMTAATIEGNRKMQVYDCTRKKVYQFVFADESARKWQDWIYEIRYAACAQKTIVR